MVRMGRSAAAGVALAVMTALVGCSSYDPEAGLDRQDYRDLLARRGPEQARPKDEPPIPELQPILAAPTPPDLVDQRRVSVTMTEETPLKDVLWELARKADVDVELDSRIDGAIIFRATDRPFGEVVHRIADLAGLRYTFENNVLRFELDEPFTRHYRVDMLNLKRTTKSSIAASTDVFAAVGGSSGGGANGSSTAIDNESENDFWTEVSDGIQRVIEERIAPPRTGPVQPASMVMPMGGSGGPQAATGAAGATDATAGSAATPTGAPAAPGGGAGSTAAASAAAAQQISQQTSDAISAASAPPASPAAPMAAAGTDEEDSQYFTINRQAGIITVFTTEKKHRKIRQYIDALRSALRGQVLIEAKVVEVTLDDKFQAGIDWNYVGIEGTTISTELTTGILPAGRTNPTLAATLGGNSPIGRALDLTAALQLLNTFGTTRTLSSPRLTVTNNETALLKVAENEVYFRLEVETETADNGVTTTTYTSELNTVPVGLLMNVQPSINTETDSITMSLRPTISRVVDQRADPAVALQAGAIGRSDITSLIPVIEVREMDSVVTMDSGSVLVMGGLMQERAAKTEEKVPGIGDVPLVGEAFKHHNDATLMTELVVFLRATIVHDRDSVHPADVDLYNKFAPDPRPIAF